MTHNQINYVRMNREKAGFSHEELARLIGQRSPSAIGHYETGARTPTLECALALELVFGRRTHELFGAFYHRIEDFVVAEAHALYVALEGKHDPVSLAKRAVLEEIPKRAIGNPLEA